MPDKEQGFGRADTKQAAHIGIVSFAPQGPVMLE
jgi:hypothetical protein